jgi:hypothetical protein
MSVTIDGNLGVSKVQDGVVVDADIASLSASKLTGSLPAGMGGKVLQVVQATVNSVFTSSANSWVDWTGMSVSITPSSSSSKFLISMTSGTGNSSNNTFAYVKLQRNGTDIALGDARGSETRCWIDASRQTDPSYPYTAKHISGEYLDSPSTGSAVIYKLQVRVTNGGSQCFGGAATVPDANRSSIPSTLTVMEIAA